MTTPLFPDTPHAQAESLALDLATQDILARLKVVADRMANAESALLSHGPDAINAIMGIQGAAMQSKLALYASLGAAINAAFQTAGQPAPVDVRTFAEKLAARGMQLTDQGITYAPQPEPAPEPAPES